MDVQHDIEPWAGSEIGGDGEVRGVLLGSWPLAGCPLPIALVCLHRGQKRLAEGSGQRGELVMSGGSVLTRIDRSSVVLANGIDEPNPNAIEDQQPMEPREAHDASGVPRQLGCRVREPSPLVVGQRFGP